MLAGLSTAVATISVHADPACCHPRLSSQVHGAILKFYNAAHAPHSPAMASMEAAAYLAQAAAACDNAFGGLGSGSGSGGGGGGSGSGGRRTPGSRAPRLLGAGVLEGWREGGFCKLQQAAEQQAAASSQAGAVAAPAAVAAGAEPEAETQAAAAQAAAGPAPPLPFIAIEKAEGATLGRCMERLTDSQWLAVAAAAGRSLAAFHSMPLPAAEAAPAGACGCHASGGYVSGGGSGGGSASTAWVARDGIVWSSTAGTLDMRGEEGASAEAAAAVLQQRQQQCLRLFPAAAAALGQGLPGSSGNSSSLAGVTASAAAGQAGAPASAVAANGGSSPAADGSGPASQASSSCAVCSAWQPFLSFLRRQRRHAAKAHRREGSLPPQLQQQLDSYLPADPAVLIGHGGCACCRAAAEDTAGQPADGGAALGSSAGAGLAAPCNGAHNACGGGSSACGGSSSLPVWVHGDLTAENLLLSSALLDDAPTLQQAEQQQGAACGGAGGRGNCSSSSAALGGSSAAHGECGGSGGGGVTLIDFADSGQGDPLWDLVPLLLRSLRCDRAAGFACRFSMHAV